MAASPDRMVAAIVGDRYEITGLIASGGMGSVYRARDTMLERIVALKVLNTGGDDPGFVARFRTEATNAARLNHPNIVQVFDFGYADGSPYMAMEYVDGQTLRDILHARGSLEPDVAARIAGRVAAALEAARREGIVHRDVKPENILVTTDGRVKVADFGLSYALAESRATQAGMLYGTAHYLSPEQVEGTTIDHRADVYSLGIVLFEMLTGRPPFEGDSPVVIAYKRVAEDVPSVLAFNADAPRDLDVVVARATARSPDARYDTAGAMGEALRRAAPRADTGEIGGLVHHTVAIPILGEQTIAVDRTKMRTTRRRWRRRRWVLGLGLAIALAVVAITNGPLAKVSVPGVDGMGQARAQGILLERGFDVDVIAQSDAVVPNGSVISQVPAEGAAIAKGGTVTLVVSSGPKLVSLPDVEGERFLDAERELRDGGFRVLREDVFDPEVPRLLVVKQDPRTGVFEEGTTVTVYVSKGPEILPVPNVVGDPERAAARDLKRKGFEVAVTRKHHDEVPAGMVIRQTPKPAARLEKGDTVELVVSLGPPLVTIPNLECMTKKQAEDRALARGLEIEFSGSGNRVVDQSPLPGERAPRGSALTAYMGLGSYC